MEKIVSLAKRRGFIYQGSEIYGGLANTYDYGPLGVELLRNIKNLWWERYIARREEIFGVHTAILMNPKVWESSGHVESFVDPLVECKKCHKRFREDHLKGKSKCPECGVPTHVESEMCGVCGRIFSGEDKEDMLGQGIMSVVEDVSEDDIGFVVCPDCG